MSIQRSYRTEHYDAFQSFKEEAVGGHGLSHESENLLQYITNFFTRKVQEHPKGKIFYRATDNRRTPMTKSDFWPKDGLRTIGRLDAEDKYFLYMADKKSTCLYEKENKYSHSPLALATMALVRNQNLSCIEAKVGWHNYFFPAEEIEFLNMIATAFHRAVADSEPEQYRPTQVIANALLSHGVDGIIFRSSKTPLVDSQAPRNVVLFDRYAAEAVSYEEISLPDDAYSAQDQKPLTQQNRAESSLCVKAAQRAID